MPNRRNPANGEARHLPHPVTIRPPELHPQRGLGLRRIHSIGSRRNDDRCPHPAAEHDGFFDCATVHPTAAAASAAVRVPAGNWVTVSACAAASNAARTRSTDPPVSGPDMPAVVALPHPYAKHGKRRSEQRGRGWARAAATRHRTLPSILLSRQAGPVAGATKVAGAWSKR